MKKLLILLTLFTLTAPAFAKKNIYNCVDAASEYEMKLTVTTKVFNGAVKSIQDIEIERFNPSQLDFNKVVASSYSANGREDLTFTDILMRNGYERETIEVAQTKSYRELVLKRNTYYVDEDIVGLKKGGVLLIITAPSPWCFGDHCHTSYFLGTCHK